MHYTFVNNVNQLQYVSIEDFYSGKSKKSFTIMGIPFYFIEPCLSLGAAGGQSLLPVKNVLDTVFMESFRYAHPVEVRRNAYSSAFQQEEGVISVDEAVPLYPCWSSNLWHWFFESFPVICMLEKYRYKGCYIVPKAPFISGLIELLPVAPERILFSGKAYLIQRALIPRMMSGGELVRNMDITKMLRNVLLASLGVLPGEKNVYVRRIQSRKIANENEVLDTIKKYDFEILVPEEHSINDQFTYMTNASLSIMPHGANTTLAIAQPKYSTFIECFGSAYVNYTNLQFIKMLRLLYIPLPERVHADKINITTDASDRQNVVVAKDVLEILLENLLAKKRRSHKKSPRSVT